MRENAVAEVVDPDAVAGRVLTYQLGLARRGFGLDQLAEAGRLAAASFHSFALPIEQARKLARTALDTVGARAEESVETPAVCTMKDLQAMLGLQHSAAYELVDRAIRRGQLSPLDFGDQKRRFDLVEVQRWLSGRSKPLARPDRKRPRRRRRLK